MNQQAKIATIRITTAAIFMALNIAFSSFGIPVPGGHLYLCDVIICAAAILLNPLEAFVVGGIGSFLGDFFFYPAPMFVSLVTHGIQAVVISVMAHYVLKKHPKISSGIGVAIGVIILVIGYTFGRTFIYGARSFEVALVKLPYEIAQGVIGAVGGMVIVWVLGINKLFKKFVVYNDNFTNNKVSSESKDSDK